MTVGNESCDLDSIVCALVMAHDMARKNAQEDNENNTISLPLIQCYQEDMVLTQEAVYLFDLMKIQTSDLLFLEDITQDTLSSVKQLSITLVDHNCPTGNLHETGLSTNIFTLNSHYKNCMRNVFTCVCKASLASCYNGFLWVP